jgi:hypothetical protein
MESWQIVGLVVLGGIAAVLIWLWITRWRYWWSSYLRRRKQSGDSIWTWRGGTWVMTADRSKPGYVPGPPPVQRGQFEGQSVRVLSVPRPQG